GVGRMPTPTIGAVGLIEDIAKIIDATASEGDLAMVLGATECHLGRSAILWEVFGRAEGDAPPVDLDAERHASGFVRDHWDWIHGCTDLSDGGLALAAFEMAAASGLGVTLDAAPMAQLFGEDQARYLIAAPYDWAEGLMIRAGQAGLPLAVVGKFGGDTVQIGDSSAPLAELQAIHDGAFEAAVG
ncbi:MAG: AIR synthase-related protein, partial [Pseudomonadota bacterium]